MRGNRIQRGWIFRFLEGGCAMPPLPECFAKSPPLKESHATSRLLENFTTILMLVTARLLPSSQQARVAVKHQIHAQMGILNPVPRGPTIFKGLHQFQGVPPVTRSSTPAGMTYRTHSRMRAIEVSGKRRRGASAPGAARLVFFKKVTKVQ